MWQLLRINFVAAVWLSIAFNLYGLWNYTLHVQQLNADWGPWVGRVVMAPLAHAGAQIFLWFRFYRFGASGARIAAACAGVAFAIIVSIQLLRASIDIPISISGTWLYAYFAASHLAYALFGRRTEAD